MNIDNLDTFTRAYIEVALWSSHGEDGSALDDDYGPEDLSPKCLAQMIEDCKNFQEHNKALLENIRPDYAGHDFWLTRNRHGAGFWDRGLGDTGKKLTDDCHAWGSVDLFAGEDGLIYSN